MFRNWSTINLQYQNEEVGIDLKSDLKSVVRNWSTINLQYQDEEVGIDLHFGIEGLSYSSFEPPITSIYSICYSLLSTSSFHVTLL